MGLALWGLPFYYDFMVQQFGWTRAQVTSGNALSKLVVGPIFGFIAGWIIDRFGPRRVMMAGILMAGGALVGLGWVSTLGMFYLFLFLQRAGLRVRRPAAQPGVVVTLVRQVARQSHGLRLPGNRNRRRHRALDLARAVEHFGWQAASAMVGPADYRGLTSVGLFREGSAASINKQSRKVVGTADVVSAFKTLPFFLLTFGSMCSIAAVSGTQQNLKLFLSLDRHFTQSEAARVLSLVLSFSIVGRLLMGWLADRFSKKIRDAADLPAGRGRHSASVPGGARSLAIYASAAMFGVGLGGDYMIIPLMTAEIFGMQILGRLLGVILTAGGIAEAVSPWLVGTLARRHRKLFRKLFSCWLRSRCWALPPCWACLNRAKTTA